MMLGNKAAAIYGGGGAIGGAVAPAFAAAGAAATSPGGRCPGSRRSRKASATPPAWRRSTRSTSAPSRITPMPWRQTRVASTSRSTPCPFPFVHDTPLAELTVDDVMHPIDAYLRTNLITAMAVARHMTAPRSGTILTLSAGAARVLPPGSLGDGTTCAAIETMTQRLAVELGPSGVRVNCVRAHLIADAPSHGSYTGELTVGGPPQRASASSSGSGGGRRT